MALAVDAIDISCLSSVNVYYFSFLLILSRRKMVFIQARTNKCEFTFGLLSKYSSIRHTNVRTCFFRVSYQETFLWCIIGP
ncbi:hypothetical protein ARMSODRAFT_180126 [Armillaria solidipes]|uniref:Uncharacterized protein n=1 Tax=Armillaria solidipes TaxID=1076256 RepID=A0A2H3BEA6_9AGAR|nr:hypothetical protein ARMSODRAFT_180126 [Armillaria solidipes]